MLSRKNKCDVAKLCNLIYEDKIENIRQLLEAGACVNVKDNTGKTPLHIAVIKERYEVVELLLKNGANVNCAYPKYGINYTPLHFAVEKGNIEIVNLLLSNGALVDAKTVTSETPLHIATEKGHLAIVETLLKHGADVNSPRYTYTHGEFTPLFFAILGKHEHIIKLLFKHGASVDSINSCNQSVLNFAVSTQNVQIVESILEQRPNINKKSNRNALTFALQRYIEFGEGYEQIVKSLIHYGFTFTSPDKKCSEILCKLIEKGDVKMVENILKNCDVKAVFILLQAATKNKQVEIVELLISNGASVNAKDKNGRPLLLYAVTDLEMMKLLLRFDVDINACDANRRTALHFTVFDEEDPFKFYRREDYRIKKEIFKLLVSKGISINVQSINGRTPLHFAVLQRSKDLLQTVIQCNADVNITDENGATPLHLAAENLYNNFCNILLDNGAEINAKQKNGSTALHIATQKERNNTVSLLLNRGANIDCRNEKKLTPFHIAVQKGYESIARILMDFGCNLDSRDKWGRTALHIASESGREEVVGALLEYGPDINITDQNGHTPLSVLLNKSRFQCHSYDSDDDAYFLNDYNRFLTVRKLQEHIIKLKTAKMYVSEQNLSYIACRTPWITNECQSKCEAEIRNMKTEEHVRVNNILTDDINRIARYARNTIIKEVLKSDEFIRTYPLYVKLMVNYFNKGLQRSKLLKQASEELYANFSVFFKLPCNCVDEILCYLSNEDLKTLINLEM